jgi:hypothetical protein
VSSECALFHFGDLAIPFQFVELLSLLILATFVNMLGPVVFSYHFTKTAFQCRLLGIVTIFSLRFDEMKQVYYYKRYLGRSLVDDYFRSVGLRNGFFRPTLRIEKTRGILRFIFVTPSDVQAFVERLRDRGVRIDDLES